MKLIKEAVENLVVYMLLVTVLMNLVKGSSYKKYIELFTGLVLILILFTPVARLFSAEQTFDSYLEANQFLLESSDFAEFIYEAEENTREELLKLYSQKITERIQLLGEKNAVCVERVHTELSPAEEGFGTIERLEVWLREKKKRDQFQRALMTAFALSEEQVIVK